MQEPGALGLPWHGTPAAHGSSRLVESEIPRRTNERRQSPMPNGVGDPFTEPFDRYSFGVGAKRPWSLKGSEPFSKGARDSPASF
jgi:hypothetical protein